MMAEEGFDVDQNQNNSLHKQRQIKQHHQTMFPSNLTSKPSVAPEASQQSGANPLAGEYYQNVKTKSKLILPTALWVLIIVGGLCFLSLLSSLNKTLGTLDTLIETEQSEHDRRDGQHNHERHLSHGHDHEHELNHKHLREIPSKLRDHEFLPVAEKLQASGSEGSLSWLSFPNWASLEPIATSGEEMPDYLESGEENMANSILENAIKSINGKHHDGLMPIGGSIIIASSGSPDDERLDERGPQRGFLSSIFDQFLGSPQGPMSGLPPQTRPFMHEQIERLPSFGRSPMFRPNKEPNNEAPLINANIDKINININTPKDQGFEIREPLNVPLKSVAPHHSGLQPNSPYELSIPKSYTEDEMAESLAQSLFKAMESANPDFAKPELSQEQIKPLAPISHQIFPLSHIHHSSSFLEPALEPTPASVPTLIPESNQETVPIFASMTMPPKPLPLPFGDSIVFINGEPLISDKNEDTQVPLIKAKDRNQVNDLFNLFFGPPPDSKLVVAQSQMIEPIKPVIRAPPPVKDEFSGSPLEQPIKVSKVSTEKLIEGDERKKEEFEPFDQELSEIFGQMLSLPQFGGQSSPQHVNPIITGGGKY